MREEFTPEAVNHILCRRKYYANIPKVTLWGILKIIILSSVTIDVTDVIRFLIVTCAARI